MTNSAAPAPRSPQQDLEAVERMIVAKQLLVYAFVDEPVKIIWITRDGAIVSEQILSASQRTQEQEPTDNS